MASSCQTFGVNQNEGKGELGLSLVRRRVNYTLR